MSKVIYKSLSVEQTKDIGEQLGTFLNGGEVIELISDLGGGKTSFVSGLAKGMHSIDPVTSPSFTICNTYTCDKEKTIAHFDFYRLNESGIVGHELSEFLGDEKCVVVIEWGEIVHRLLPENTIQISLSATSESGRKITISSEDDDLIDKLINTRRGEQ